MLNTSHKPSRGNKDKVATIKKEAVTLKEQVKRNLIDNATDQNQESTIVEFASAFDFTRKVDKDSRLKHIKNLFNVYGREAKNVISDAKFKGDLNDFNITIRYQRKIKCTEEELLSEFKSLWPTLSKVWLQIKDTKPQSDRIKRFWTMIVEEHAIEYPNLADLIILLLSISPGTGPVERSFSQLAKICYKDRNSMAEDTIENLFLLAAMKVDEDDDQFISHARKVMQM